MEPITTILVLTAAYRGIKALYQGGKSPVATPVPPPVLPPQRAITLVGPTGAGKSSTANALLRRSAFQVDADHNTTKAVTSQPYRGDYTLSDTPGLMDVTDYTVPVWNTIERSELVIYTCTGQLLRPELEVVQRIAARQADWNRQCSSGKRRHLALFVNRQDLKRLTMCSADRQKELNALRVQVGALLPSSHIVCGAASPINPDGRPLTPQVDDLRALIHSLLGISWG